MRCRWRSHGGSRGRGLVDHSDHGSQYVSLAMGEHLREAGIDVSMGSKGSALDNAVVESFFASLKIEPIDRQVWPAREAARLAIFEYVEVWYNRRRRHSTLGYTAPAAYEALVREVTAA